MTRTTQEVFDSHQEAIETGNLEQLAADYAEDAILVTIDGACSGREAIMNDFFMPVLSQFPDVKIVFEKASVYEDVCLLQWSAEASAMTIPRGTAVFIIQDGLIQQQGEWFEMVLKEVEKTRTTQEVFDAHREAIETGNMEQLAADYAEDAVLVTGDGSCVGKEAIFQDFFMPMLSQFPDVKITYDKVSVEGDTCLLQWSADASKISIPTGVGFLQIQDGLIQRQGEWFEIVPKEG